MKLLLYLFILPIYVFAAIHSVQLFASNAKDKEIDGLGLQYLSEVYPEYYIFLDNGTSYYFYDDLKNVIYYDNKVRFYLTNGNGILKLAPQEPLKINIDLNTGISNLTLFAKKNIDDPKNYSSEIYAVLVDDNFKGGRTFNLTVKKV